MDRQKGWVKGWIDKRWTVKGGIDKGVWLRGKRRGRKRGCGKDQG